MDLHWVIKFSTLAVGTISGAKYLYDLWIGRRGRLREEYQFAQAFFLELSRDKNMHPFLKEKGYQAIAGDNKLSAIEIEYLLSLENPERALRDYALGSSYLEHLPNSGNLQIKFKEKYQGKWARLWRKGWYTSWYFLLVFIAFMPLLVPGWIGVNKSQALTTFLLFLGVFGPYAWFSLKAATRIYRAEVLVSNQSKHTQRIYVDSSGLFVKKHSQEQIKSPAIVKPT